LPLFNGHFSRPFCATFLTVTRPISTIHSFFDRTFFHALYNDQRNKPFSTLFWHIGLCPLVAIILCKQKTKFNFFKYDRCANVNLSFCKLFQLFRRKLLIVMLERVMPYLVSFLTWAFSSRIWSNLDLGSTEKRVTTLVTERGVRNTVSTGAVEQKFYSAQFCSKPQKK